MGGGAAGTGTVTTIESTISNALNLNLHTLSFGPQLTFNTKMPKLTLGGSFGLALNIADWNFSTDETLSATRAKTLATWHAEKSGTEVLPGFYLEANTSYLLSTHWAVTAFGRYDWSDDLHGNNGAGSFLANAGLDDADAYYLSLFNAFDPNKNRR